MKPEDSYYNKRRDRLSDVVGDYLTDESLTAKDFYRDLMAEVQSWVDYHGKELKRAIEFKKLISTNSFTVPTSNRENCENSCEENLNMMCENVTPDKEKEKCREYNLREAEYYNQRALIDAQNKKSKYYYDTNRNKGI